MAPCAIRSRPSSCHVSGVRAPRGSQPSAGAARGTCSVQASAECTYLSVLGTPCIYMHTYASSARLKLRDDGRPATGPRGRRVWLAGCSLAAQPVAQRRDVASAQQHMAQPSPVQRLGGTHGCGRRLACEGPFLDSDAAGPSRPRSRLARSCAGPGPGPGSPARRSSQARRGQPDRDP